jgi:hypothetical protein
VGLNATFTLVSCEQYERIRADRNATAEAKPRVFFDMDKSWAFFDGVFKSYGEPLSRVFEGDYLPDGLWQGGTHFGYISPALALAIGQALVGVEPEQVFARATELGRPLEPGRELFYRDFFFELKIGFRVAARCGGGLAVCIC